jgi:hypothetical protein
VCKTWSDIALSALWSDVHDLYHLLSLLVPLKKRRDSIYVRPFHHPILHSILTFSRNIGTSPHTPINRLHPFLPLRPTRPSTALQHPLPLQQTPTSQRIRRDCSDASAVGHLTQFGDVGVDNGERDGFGDEPCVYDERVKKFVVWLPFDGRGTEEVGGLAQPYFQEVSARMPNLTYLDLRMHIPMRHLSQSITTSLLPHLPSLQTIILPNYHLTSPILTTLSRLPHLGTIQFEYGSDQGVGDIEDIQHLHPNFEEGSFPALWDLSLSATLGDMIKILERPSPQTPTATLASHSPLGNLTSLYVDCPGLQTAEEVYTFLRCVVQSCRLLKALYLELLWMDIPSIYPSRDDRITFEILQPLLDCPNLMYVPLLRLARSATNGNFGSVSANSH